MALWCAQCIDPFVLSSESSRRNLWWYDCILCKRVSEYLFVYTKKQRKDIKNLSLHYQITQSLCFLLDFLIPPWNLEDQDGKFISQKLKNTRDVDKTKEKRLICKNYISPPAFATKTRSYLFNDPRLRRTNEITWRERVYRLINCHWCRQSHWNQVSFVVCTMFRLLIPRAASRLLLLRLLSVQLYLSSQFYSRKRVSIRVHARMTVFRVNIYIYTRTQMCLRDIKNKTI